MPAHYYFPTDWVCPLIKGVHYFSLNFSDLESLILMIIQQVKQAYFVLCFKHPYYIMTLLIISRQIFNLTCRETSRGRGCFMSDFQVRPLFKGAHYYLSFPLPAPIIQGRTVFKGVYYSRKYGTLGIQINVCRMLINFTIFSQPYAVRLLKFGYRSLKTLFCLFNS